MFAEMPKELLLISAGAFFVGWILSAINSRLGDRKRARKRDHRDDRIRELEAELRVAQSRAEDSRTDLQKLEDQLKETTIGLERRDFVISEQQARIDRTASDLKDSVIKTRELRAELANRATENVQAEAKIREVQTRLSVVEASSDLIATGVLDYSDAPESNDTESDGVSDASNDPESGSNRA